MKMNDILKITDGNPGGRWGNQPVSGGKSLQCFSGKAVNVNGSPPLPSRGIVGKIITYDSVRKY